MVMVRFEKDKMIIEYTAGCNAVEEWLGLHEELTFVLTSIPPESQPHDGLWRIAELLNALVPDYETARRMMKY